MNNLTATLASKTKSKDTKKNSYEIVKGQEALVDQIKQMAVLIKSKEALLTTLKADLATVAFEHHIKTKKGGTLGFASSTDGDNSIAEEKFQYSGVDAVNTEGKDSDAVTEIKKLTKKQYDTFFEIKRKITLDTSDEEKLDKLITLLDEHGMMDMISATQTVTPTKTFHENKYTLDRKVVEQLDTLLKPVRAIKS
jgi:hypothetical protein